MLRLAASRVLRWPVLMLLGVITAYSVYAEWQGFVRLHLFRYDYAFFYYAFKIVLQNQPNSMLYHQPAQQAFLASLGFPLRPDNQYVYPPQFAVVWAFLGKFSFSHSATLWFAISTIFFTVGLYLLIRLIWPESNWKIKTILILAGLSVMPVQVDLGAGNVNSVLFGLAALTFYFLYHSRREWLAGIPLGFAIVFKVTPVAILVYLLMRRNWRTGISSILTVILLSVWSSSVLTLNSLLYYAAHFFSFGQTSMKNGAAPYNQSLLGVIEALRNHHVLHWSGTTESLVFLAYMLITAFVFLFMLRKTPITPHLDLALSSLALLLFSPLVEEMHMIFAIPALLVLVRLGWQEGSVSGKFLRLAARLISMGSLLVMSLPATFALNVITNRWPQLFWLHTQMLWVLVGVSLIVFGWGWSLRGRFSAESVDHRDEDETFRVV